MKRRTAPVRFVLALAILVAAAALLNPSPERHRARIQQAVAERNQLAGWLRLGDITAWVSSYHSLGLASYTTVNDRLLSVGLLGWVYVPDPSIEP